MDFSDQAHDYASEGYAVFERALDQEALGTLREECGAVIAREDARLDALGRDVDGITHRGQRYFAGECQRARPALRQILFGEAMAAICRATLGPDVYFFYDQFVVKGAGGGMKFGWHQDSGYVVGNGGPAGHKPYLTCWCPLDDTNLANGTVRVLPYSHLPESREGVVEHRREPGSNDLIGYAGADEGVALEVAAGSVVAFSSRTLHATGANTTDRLRRVYLAQYSPEPILNADGQLRRNAVAFLRGGEQVTLA